MGGIFEGRGASQTPSRNRDLERYRLTILTALVGSTKRKLLFEHFFINKCHCVACLYPHSTFMITLRLFTLTLPAPRGTRLSIKNEEPTITSQ